MQQEIGFVIKEMINRIKTRLKGLFLTFRKLFLLSESFSNIEHRKTNYLPLGFIGILVFSTGFAPPTGTGNAVFGNKNNSSI
jgi:hypothetical protein